MFRSSSRLGDLTGKALAATNRSLGTLYQSGGDKRRTNASNLPLSLEQLDRAYREALILLRASAGDGEVGDSCEFGVVQRDLTLEHV